MPSRPSRNHNHTRDRMPANPPSTQGRDPEPKFANNDQKAMYISFRDKTNAMVNRYAEMETVFKTFTPSATRNLFVPDPVQKFTTRAIFDPAPVSEVLAIRELWLQELRQADAALKAIARNEKGGNPQRTENILKDVEDLLLIANRSLRKAEDMLEKVSMEDTSRRERAHQNWMNQEERERRARSIKALWHDIYRRMREGVEMPEAVRLTLDKRKKGE